MRVNRKTLADPHALASRKRTRRFPHHRPIAVALRHHALTATVPAVPLGGARGLESEAVEEFERLGQFYLGKRYDVEREQSTEELVLYDTRDLTTHAVIVGMTGSGKTGLGIGLLEEAALDRIPVIAIDPKGDLGNLLLTFPDFSAADFQPWVDAQRAAEQGRTVEQYAADQAALWREGLARWGQSPERVRRLRDAVDMALYTPGSTAGLPLSVLRAFTAPPAETHDDAELYRERIATTATGILALLGIDADPLSSREHILVAKILEHAWDAGQDLDIAALIGLIQRPPLERLGVMDVDAFFPPKDRFALAMQLNNLLAAPGFEVWLQGQPLDAGQLLHTSAGKPRLSVMSIAHLSDAERMFFVAMLLNEILGWMRRQPGTGSLRAVLYMDEIFGYLPPTANPPSKLLLLTLLKQARAYGLGLVLATQNPVDLDYKGLSNTGTWFIGRLQTERDKARLMDGLEGAASGARFDRARTERILAGLGKRRFLLHNVHENEPVVFETRWVMSYLAGPMTREQIKALVGSDAREAATPVASAAGARAPPATPVARRALQSAPLLPPAVPQVFLPLAPGAGAGETLVYHPMLVAVADLTYANARYRVDTAQTLALLTEIGDEPVPVNWDHSDEVALQVDRLAGYPEQGARYAELTAPAADPRNYAAWQRALKRWLRENRPLVLLRSPQLKTVSALGESERDFRVRLQQLAHERRDVETGKLRRRYESQFTTLQDRLRSAEQRVETEAAQSRQKKIDTAIAVGQALLGAFLGRKRVSATAASRVGTAARSASRIGKESADVERARERAEALRGQIAALTLKFEQDVAALESAYDAASEVLEEVRVRPKATEIHVRVCALGWAPYRSSGDGRLTAAWSSGSA